MIHSSLPVELASAPFALDEARRLGIPYSRLRRADLHRPFRGIRSTEIATSAVARCVAHAPRLTTGQAFCGWSAARLWGMWLPVRPRWDDLVHVTAVGNARAPRIRGVVGHHADVADLRFAQDLPATSPSSTWWSLGSILTLDELVAAGDSLLRRTSPLCMRSELEAGGSLHAGRRGVSRCRQALPLIRSLCDSAKETDLRLLLWRAGLPEPDVNPVVLETRNGKRYGDLVFWQFRVIAEYDGGQHRTDARQFSKDVIRFEELAHAGWTVVRVLKEHMVDEVAVADRVRNSLRANGWPG